MTAFQFPDQTGFYKGKVRDVYTIKHQILVMIASDRLSAFDVILPKPIPFKGQVLNQLSAYMLNRTHDICPNWLRTVPAPNVSLGIKCEPFKVEVVVRGNVCGHAWRTYQNGGRTLCGVSMPEGLKENDFFPEPIITPSTKADAGHDEDITVDQLLQQRLLSQNEWETVSQYALSLFKRGNELAAQQGLILADTKYEFGKRNGEVILMDEIHTPDSSRYFYKEGFEARQLKGEKQKQLSKEFVREWLMANGFMGKQNEVIPDMNEEWINTISGRYIELYEVVTGEKFKPEVLSEQETMDRIQQALLVT